MSAGASPAVPAGVTSHLSAGVVLRIGQQLVSPKGEYRFVVQGDDNVVEYVHNTAASIPPGALWATNTSRGAGHRVVIGFAIDQRCRPYLFDTKNSVVIWRVNNVPLATHCYLALQDDGDLVDYGYRTSSPHVLSALWHTGTSATGYGIATLASDQLGDHYCSVNSLGGVGFGGTGSPNNSCDGSADPHGEFWCADFTSWVWEQTVTDGFGVIATYTDPKFAGGTQQTLSPWAPNFARYGWAHGTFSDTGAPKVGDVVLLSQDRNAYGAKLTEKNVDEAIEHVAIVTKVAGSQMSTVSGDWGGNGTGSDQLFWSTSTVTLVASSDKVGASFDDAGLWVAGFVSPVTG